MLDNSSRVVTLGCVDLDICENHRNPISLHDNVSRMLVEFDKGEVHEFQ